MFLKENILYEDNHLIIINKWCGKLVQGDSTGDRSLDEAIKEFIKVRDDKPGDVFLGVVHRIDRPVSGVVIFAKTSKGVSRMNELLRKREIEKRYWAIVQNAPAKIEDTLIHYMTRDRRANRSTAHQGKGKGRQRAELHYKMIASSDNYHLLDVNLITGRHHQVRAQLSAIGCPIKGDLKYGAPRSNPGGGISLHARSVKFIHPVRLEPVEVIAPAPNDDTLWEFFESVIG